MGSSDSVHQLLYYLINNKVEVSGGLPIIATAVSVTTIIGMRTVITTITLKDLIKHLLMQYRSIDVLIYITRSHDDRNHNQKQLLLGRPPQLVEQN